MGFFSFVDAFENEKIEEDEQRTHVQRIERNGWIAAWIQKLNGIEIGGVPYVDVCVCAWICHRISDEEKKNRKL